MAHGSCGVSGTGRAGERLSYTHCHSTRKLSGSALRARPSRRQLRQGRAQRGCHAGSGGGAEGTRGYSLAAAPRVRGTVSCEKQTAAPQWGSKEKAPGSDSWVEELSALNLQRW